MTRLLATTFSDDPELRGWLSLPDGTMSRDCGAVICAPFGDTGIGSYRPLRTLAEHLAEAGWPVLRFDWPGAGDSADLTAPIAETAVWTDAVAAAVNHLREVSGVPDVALVGLRIGGTVAALAAASLPVRHIALLAPFVNGAGYLRELRAFEMLAPRRGEPSSAPPPLPAGAFEAAGFLLCSEEVAALRRLDLGKIDASAFAGRRLLIAAPQLDRGLDDLAERMAGTAEVSYHVVPDLVHTYDGPLESAFPRTCSDTVIDWLAAESPLTSRQFPDVELRTSIALIDGSVRESIASISTPRGNLVGVTCEPQAAGDAWVVLLNAGSINRSGPNRLWTTFARAWAKAETPSLRLDFHGVGDSDPVGRGDTVSRGLDGRGYTPDHLDDIAAALSWLVRERNAQTFVLIGLCSGAYWAARAAGSEPRVAAAVPINPLTWYWDPDLPRVRAFTTLRRIVGDPSAWWPAIRHGRRPSTRWALQGMGVILSQPGRNRRLRRGVREVLDRLSTNGVATRVVISDDLGLDYLANSLGDDYPAELARRGVVLDVVRGPDHTFRPLWSHPLLQQALETHLRDTGYLPATKPDERATVAPQ